MNKLNDILNKFNSLDPKKQCEWVINSIWDEIIIEELIERKCDNKTKDIITLLCICNNVLESKEKYEPLQLNQIYPLWLVEVRENQLNKLEI